MVLLRRVLLLLLFVGLFLGACVAVARIVLVPVAEDRAQAAMRRAFDAKAEVKLNPPFRPGLLRGDVGDIRVHVDSFHRGLVTVDGTDVVVDRGRLGVRDLVSGRINLSFDDIRLTGHISQAVLTAVARRQLAEAGVTGVRRLFVRVAGGRATAGIPGRGLVPVSITVADERHIAIVPRGTTRIAALLRTAVARPVDVGPLPYGIRLTGLRLGEGRVDVTGGRGAGTVLLR